MHRLVFLNLKMTSQQLHVFVFVACLYKQKFGTMYCTICNVAAEVLNEYH